jgi:hypothetical protein
MWATNCADWDDRGADLQCVTCRRDSTQNSSSSSLKAKSKIAVVIVTKGDVKANLIKAYEVLDQPANCGRLIAQHQNAL